MFFTRHQTQIFQFNLAKRISTIVRMGMVHRLLMKLTRLNSVVECAAVVWFMRLLYRTYRAGTAMSPVRVWEAGPLNKRLKCKNMHYGVLSNHMFGQCSGLSWSPVEAPTRVRIPVRTFPIIISLHFQSFFNMKTSVLRLYVELQHVFEICCFQFIGCDMIININGSIS